MYTGTELLQSQLKLSVVVYAKRRQLKPKIIIQQCMLGGLHYCGSWKDMYVRQVRNYNTCEEEGVGNLILNYEETGLGVIIFREMHIAMLNHEHYSTEHVSF